MSFRPITAALLAALVAAPVSATSVWINEIHYDNHGADYGEFVEIAGAASTDLTGWSLVFYNGGSGADYRTAALSGALANDTGTGFGFSALPVAGIQNGGPDGLALVDNLGSVIQFLSYEGQFTATSGVANGLASSDIGVFEPADTKAGLSLQLFGTGSRYADFSWAGPAASTRGAINGGQALSPVPVPPALLLFGSALGLLGYAGFRRPE